MTRSPRFLLLLSGAYVALLVVALLFPYTLELPLEYQPNAVAGFQGEAGVEFQGNGIIVSPTPASALHAKLLRGSGLTVEVWLKTTEVRQRGPARIVTYSLDKLLRNFTVGQENTDLVFRLRTAETDLNGVKNQLVVPNVFRKGEVIHLVLTYDFSSVRVYINGKDTGVEVILSGELSNWSNYFKFALGNEISGNRPWIGRLFRVSIYSSALSEVHALRHFDAGPQGSPAGIDASGGDHRPVVLYDFSGSVDAVSTTHDRARAIQGMDLVVPDSVRILHKPFLSVPYRYIDPQNLTAKQSVDLLLNVLIFVPLGFLLYCYCRRLGHGWGPSTALVLLGGSLLSLVVEVIQFWVHTRSSSLTDMIHNVLGVVVGLTAARLSSGKRRAARSSRDP